MPTRRAAGELRRTHITQILCDIYEFDMTLDNDEPVME